MVEGKLTGVTDVITKLGKIPGMTMTRLGRTMTGLAIEMQAYVKSSKLSGQVLKNRTGTLRRSITYRVDQRPNEVIAFVGTNVRYARPHEFGWKGQVLIRKAFGRTLKFPVWKSVNLPERSFLRSSLQDKAQRIKDMIKRDIAGELR